MDEICDRACENWVCVHKLHPASLQVISQYWNTTFLFCNLHNKFLLSAETFIARACWDEFRKIEKVGKNHVPTCPVFTGPVTYDDYHQWAAARNVRQWGELNFSMHGHCLLAEQPLSISLHPWSSQSPAKRNSSYPSSKKHTSNGTSEANVTEITAHTCTHASFVEGHTLLHLAPWPQNIQDKAPS